MENGFFGTEEHKRMQAKSDDLVPWILDTPGACITGRVISADDCETLGWEVIRQHLQEDGMFGFRFMPPEEIDAIRVALSDLDVNVQEWSGFYSPSEKIKDAIDPICATEIPDGMRIERLQGPQLRDMQVFLAAQGMTPLSTASLGCELFPAVPLGVLNDAGKIVAVGWGAMSQNKHSAHAKCAWAGLFAVAPEAQGKGLGKRLNAEVLHICIEEFDAEGAMEFAAADNAASIRMIKSVGLEPTDRVSAVAMLGAARSFTR